MTIYDLDWQPARFGTGFIASCRFDDGITAYLRSENGERYNLLVDLRSDGRRTHEDLDRGRVNGLLSHYEMAHAL